MGVSGRKWQLVGEMGKWRLMVKWELVRDRRTYANYGNYTLPWGLHCVSEELNYSISHSQFKTWVVKVV